MKNTLKFDHMQQLSTKVFKLSFEYLHTQGESEKVALWGFLAFSLNGWEVIFLVKLLV